MLLGGRRRRRQRLHRRARPAIGRRTVVKGEVDGHRGDRPERGARGRRLSSRRDRPRRVDHPARRTRRRATSSPRPCTSTATRSATSCSSRPPAGPHARQPAGALAAFAREQLRREFLAADMGVTGGNFGVAETGSIVLVDERGQRPAHVPRSPGSHVAMMGMERIVGPGTSSTCMINLLARSAPASTSDLHEHHHRAAPRGRGRRTRRAARRHPRQRPQRAAGHRVAGDPLAASAAAPASTCAPSTARSAGTPTAGCTAAPSARCSRRCSPARPRRGGRAGQRVDAVRRVHGCLPREHPAPGPAAHPATAPGREANRAERAAWKTWAAAWSRPSRSGHP